MVAVVVAVAVVVLVVVVVVVIRITIIIAQLLLSPRPWQVAVASRFAYHRKVSCTCSRTWVAAPRCSRTSRPEVEAS